MALGVADVIRMVLNLGGVGSQFVGVNDPKFKGGENLAGAVTSMSADALTPIAKLSTRKIADKAMHKLSVDSQQKVNNAIIKAGGNDAVLKWPSLILTTISVADVLELTTGFGPPHQGDDLRAGSQQFTALVGQLRSALPDDNWQGSASRAYAELDAALQDFAQKMATLDKDLADLIKDQADMTTHMRLGFGTLKGFLLGAYAVEIALLLAPMFGPPAAKAWAIGVSAVGMTAAVGFITNLVTFSVLNGNKAKLLTADYNTVAAKAVQNGTGAEAAAVAAAAPSTVSGFEEIAARLSGGSAVADVARVASGTADERAARGALRDETPTGGIPGAPQTPGDAPPDPDEAPPAPYVATPAAPGLTMPSMAQVAAMAGQVGKLSGHASQHLNVVNQGAGSVQQLASLFKQFAPAEEPAAAEAVTDEPTLTSGVEGAERAPVEAEPVGAEASQRPGPAAPRPPVPLSQPKP